MFQGLDLPLNELVGLVCSSCCNMLRPTFKIALYEDHMRLFHVVYVISLICQCFTHHLHPFWNIIDVIRNCFTLRVTKFISMVGKPVTVSLQNLPESVFSEWGLEDSSILKRLLVSLPGAALNKSMVGKHPRNPGPQFVGCFNEATVSSGFLWQKRRWELIVTFFFQVLQCYALLSEVCDCRGCALHVSGGVFGLCLFTSLCRKSFVSGVIFPGSKQAVRICP